MISTSTRIISRGLTNRLSALPSRANTLSATQRLRRRQVHFLPFLGLWGAKHLTVWTMYNACKNYGWPKVYRRLLEQNRNFYAHSIEGRRQSQAVIRMALEAPPQFAAQVSQHLQVVTPLLQDLAHRALPNVPSFLVAMAKFLVNSQKPVKVVQDMMAASSKLKK